MSFAAALGRDVAAAFHNILLVKWILHAACCSDPPRPVIFPGVPLHCLQERLAHRVHRTPLLPFPGIKKAPIISD